MAKLTHAQRSAAARKGWRTRQRVRRTNPRYKAPAWLANHLEKVYSKRFHLPGWTLARDHFEVKRLPDGFTGSALFELGGSGSDELYFRYYARSGLTRFSEEPFPL